MNGYMETINQLRKNAVQLNKYGQTISKQYRRANQTRRNFSGPRNGTNCNN